MDTYDTQLLELIQKTNDVEKSIEIAISIILNYVTLPQLDPKHSVS